MFFFFFETHWSFIRGPNLLKVINSTRPDFARFRRKDKFSSYIQNLMCIVCD